jgi:tRNA-specific adenosine deaminase 1
MVPSNVSAVYTTHFQETLVGGVLQGRKQFDPRGASALCRKSMWRAVTELSATLNLPWLVDVTRAATYKELKSCDVLEPRKRVKADVCDNTLKGWIRNDGDDGFGIDT